MTLTEELGVVGLAISLVLAVIRALEFSRSRLWLQVVPLFRGDRVRGHDILLVNRSSEPVFIYNYDIVCTTRKGDPQPRVLFSLEDEFCDVRIESMSRFILRFADEEYFPWVNASEGRTFIRLWTAGHSRPRSYDVTCE
jgi:hypothetical protein